MTVISENKMFSGEITVELIGYIFPKFKSECPICKKNVFGKSLARFRNWIHFGNHLNLAYGDILNCYYCETTLKIKFQKGRYISEVHKK